MSAPVEAGAVMAVPKAFANRLRGRSVALRSFSRPPLPQSDARSAAVLVEEFDTGRYNCRLNLLSCAFSATEPTIHRFKARNSGL
jgi:hypothetical protein